MRKLFVTFIYTILVRPWLTFFIGVSFHNVKHLRDAEQFIIVANHNSHFDTVSIMAALPSKLRKNTCAVASGDYFGKSSLTVSLMKLFFNAILITKKVKPEGNFEFRSIRSKNKRREISNHVSRR